MQQTAQNAEVFANNNININTIASLAILRVNWDKSHNKKDYISIFLPFLATLIQKNNYWNIPLNESVQMICDDFKNEYGLVIGYHPMMTILNRAYKKKLLEKKHGKFIPVKEKIIDIDFSSRACEQSRRQEKLINCFIEYTQEKYDLTLSEIDAENILLSYLRENYVSVIESAWKVDLPIVKNNKTNKYIGYSFIKDACISEPEIFHFIIDISMGYVLANALFFNELEGFDSSLKGLSVYLDTRFIFRLLGIEGIPIQHAYEDFIKMLAQYNAQLYIFNHTYCEIMGILEDANRRISNLNNFDPLLSSNVLKYFVHEGKDQSDVTLFICRLKNNLRDLGIKIAEDISPDIDKQYQIDELSLYNHIIDVYKQKDKNFDVISKEFTIQNDIKSITLIHKLRKGQHALNIKEARNIFVTTNGSLAYACKKFEDSQYNLSTLIPACVTDVYLGTLLWLQSPSTVCYINSRKILADCSAALVPDDILIKKFINEVDKLKNQGSLKSEEYYLLRSSGFVLNLLEDRTLGDSDNFSDKTTEEILKQMKDALVAQEKEKYVEEQEAHSHTKEELIKLKQINDKLEQQQNALAQRISNIISKITVGLFYLIVIIGSWLLNKNNIIEIGNIIFVIIALFMLLLSFLTYVPLYKSIDSKINHRVYKAIINYINKT